MNYTKKEIGEGLFEHLKNRHDISRISNWAYDLYVHCPDKISNEIEEILQSLFIMEAGPEFVYTKQELQLLVKKLLDEDTKEELGNPIAGIKDIATDLGYNWVMCPLCQEAWKDHSIYGMLRCPKCNSKLHNPYYDKIPK